MKQKYKSNPYTDDATKMILPICLQSIMTVTNIQTENSRKAAIAAIHSLVRFGPDCAMPCIAAIAGSFIYFTLNIKTVKIYSLAK